MVDALRVSGRTPLERLHPATLRVALSATLRLMLAACSASSGCCAGAPARPLWHAIVRVVGQAGGRRRRHCQATAVHVGCGRGSGRWRDCGAAGRTQALLERSDARQPIPQAKSTVQPESCLPPGGQRKPSQQKNAERFKAGRAAMTAQRPHASAEWHQHSVTAVRPLPGAAWRRQRQLTLRPSPAPSCRRSRG